MGNNDSSVETFLQWIKASDNIVFFGGAGVSTESGIPDFRSVDGLYNQKYDYPPETILSHTFYRKHPQEFYRFYRDKMLCLDAEPNITHYKLAELEKAGKLIGLAFQIRDDMLDEIGKEEDIGKPVHSDADNMKTTYVSLYGLEKAQEDVESYSSEAIEILKSLGNNEFLTELITYLTVRNK